MLGVVHVRRREEKGMEQWQNDDQQGNSKTICEKTYYNAFLQQRILHKITWDSTHASAIR
jgi:hypothetical protein